jgi:5-methylcytosine-specific restriction endonuclease McrA
MNLRRRLNLYGRQGGKCPYCMRHMERWTAKQRPDGTYDNGFTVEHVMPIALGGRKAEFNCVLVHAKCNYEKADRAPTQAEIDLLALVHGDVGCRIRMRAANP